MIDMSITIPMELRWLGPEAQENSAFEPSTAILEHMSQQGLDYGSHWGIKMCASDDVIGMTLVKLWFADESARMLFKLRWS